MARVEIIDSLAKEIQKKFKGESNKIVKLLRTLEENPHKGKFVGRVSEILIKELKYKSFRFYFLVDGHKLMIYSKEELANLLIKIVRMSDKKSQQETINEIKNILLKISAGGF
ncbi:MAG: hypothetical protein AABY06_03465 [Nanoarchaeota archaeon]